MARVVSGICACSRMICNEVSSYAAFGRPELSSDYPISMNCLCRSDNVSAAVGSSRPQCASRTLARSISRDPFPFPRPRTTRHRRGTSGCGCLIGALDRLIAKKRDLKQAAMQQLLTGKTRLPGFNGEWQVKRLGDRHRIAMGKTPSQVKPRIGDGTSVSHITDFNRDVRELRRTIGSNRILRNNPQRTLFNGIQASLAHKSGSDFSRTKRFRAVICSPQMRQSFCMLIFRLSFVNISTRTQARRTGTNTTPVKSKLLELRLPPLPEQTAIAAVLSDMDAELAALEQRRDKTRALKQGMMQELLTGRTRMI